MFAWILIGLISGWLAGKILNGNGYGMMADIGLGLLGGMIGGMIFAGAGRARAQLHRRHPDVDGGRHGVGGSDKNNPRRNLKALG